MKVTLLKDLPIGFVFRELPEDQRSVQNILNLYFWGALQEYFSGPVWDIFVKTGHPRR
jgi:hypothetical protein